MADVLLKGAAMDKTDRWAAWVACGEHDMDSLPKTATGGSGPLRYCQKCWTLFGRDDVPFNRPCPE